MCSHQSQVLIAIMNNLLDMSIAQDQGWYRIPVASVERFLKNRWPPEWLALYQTKTFGDQAYAINFFARVLEIHQVNRSQLFPNEPLDERAYRQYYQLILSPLQKLSQPIVSRRWRRITFIPTIWAKFVNAVEINDLYDDSPLEDLMWTALKLRQIFAERQELIQVKDKFYMLDFAIHCALGNLDVEIDGDTWHADRERISLDNQRDNDLHTAGWDVLRFNTRQIKEQLPHYCVPTIIKNLNRLGGLEEGKVIPRKIDPRNTSDWYQPSLFDQDPNKAK
jgi:very-short-patch-repair endonuclease